MNLAACALVMAAKLEEPAIPSFSRMVALVEEECGVLITKEDLIILEEDIVRELDFDLMAPYPEVFVERYLRIFGMDAEGSNFQARQVGALARFFTKRALKSMDARKFSSSQLAAASVMFALNLSKSPVAYELSLSQLKNVDYKNFFHEATTAKDVSTCPALAQWNSEVAALTRLARERDVAPCYKFLVKYLNESEYAGSLKEHKDLFCRCKDK
jgi:hypothetical protein